MYKRYRVPAEIIQYAVWLYYRFSVSHRDIEDLLAQRGIIVTHESIRLWCNKFGSKYAARLRKRHQGYGDTFFIDEVLRTVRINAIFSGICKYSTILLLIFCRITAKSHRNFATVD